MGAMRRNCVGGRHQAGSRPVRNQGFEFGRCWICGLELVRSRGAWRRVPKGFRIVWRQAGRPVTQGAGRRPSRLPASRGAFALPSAARRARRRIAAAAELAALGVYCLGWALVDRGRLWTRALLAARPPAPAALRLRAG